MREMLSEEFEGTRERRFYGTGTLEVSGPDQDGEYRIAVTEDGNVCIVYLTRGSMENLSTLVEQMMAVEDAG